MRARKLILIVDDERMNRTLLRDLLQAYEYATVEAVTGREGVDTAKAEIPDLILMDIQLPELNGIQAIGLLKQDEATREIPILVLSGFSEDEERERVLAAGCTGYISKPIDTRVLMKSIAEILV